LHSFQKGDRIEFVKDWDPGLPPDDPFYFDPVPKGTRGVVVEASGNHVRVKFDDSQTWPKPVLIWKDGVFDDQVQDGYSCMELTF
jgi:hypothetical protein